MIDLFLFGVFPYIAVVVGVGGSIWRYRTDQFTYSSVSSQFLEGRQLFWGSVSWHYGIIILLLGHLVGVLFPSGVMAFNGVPLRLYILEGTALALGLLVLVGVVILLVRRGINPRIRVVTSPMDVVLLSLLLLQVVTGVGVAIFYRWGSGWFVETATPYFWSLVKLSPSLGYMVAQPLLIKIHAINAFVLVLIFPFTRLVHMVSIPWNYLWRPYQVVVWHRHRRQPQ